MLKKDIILKKDEIEKKLFEIFPDLKDEKKFHNFFSSYDFHDNEIFMVHFWKDIIEYITVHLKEDFAINYGQLISYTRFKNFTPLGLPNIIKKLINDGEFLLASDLDTDEFYKKNYPEIYPKDSWGQFFKKNIVNTFWGGLSDKKEIKNNDFLIEKKTFLVKK